MCNQLSCGIFSVTLQAPLGPLYTQYFKKCWFLHFLRENNATAEYIWHPKKYTFLYFTPHFSTSQDPKTLLSKKWKSWKNPLQGPLQLPSPIASQNVLEVLFSFGSGSTKLTYWFDCREENDALKVLTFKMLLMLLRWYCSFQKLFLVSLGSFSFATFSLRVYGSETSWKSRQKERKKILNPFATMYSSGSLIMFAIWNPKKCNLWKFYVLALDQTQI